MCVATCPSVQAESGYRPCPVARSDASLGGILGQRAQAGKCLPCGGLAAAAGQAYNRGVEALRDVLEEYPAVMLEAIADGWRVSLTDEQLPEIVDRLVAEMTQPEAVRATVQRLSEEQREALALVAAQGQVKAHVLTRKYGQVRRLGPGRLEWEAAWRQPVSVAEGLWFLGLICRTYAADAVYHGEVFAVPAEIRRILPPMDVVLPAFRVQPAVEPIIVKDEQDALARDIFVILSHLRNHDVRAKDGVLARYELDRIRNRLSAMDRPRLLLLWRVCEQAGLVHREDGTWQPTQRAAAWLNEDALSRRRMLFHTWLADAGWDELCAMPSVRCEDTGWRHDPVLARGALVRHLRRCPAGVWLEVNSLVTAIHETDPDFLRPDGDYGSWYIRDAQSGQYLLGFASWHRVEGALIRYLLEHALCWLGVVALGYPQESEQATAFRVTTTAAVLLSEESAPASGESVDESHAPAERIVVRRDLTILVPSGVSWYDRFLVERFARWVDEQGGVARYAMDTHSVKRALSRGVTVAQIEVFLKRATGKRVPIEVQRMLRDMRA